MAPRTLNISEGFIFGLDGDRHGDGDANGDNSLPLNDDLAVAAVVAVAPAVRTRLLLPARLNVDGDDLDGIVLRRRLGLLNHRRRSRWLGLGLGFGLLLR
jgi:hypothetical protein